MNLDRPLPEPPDRPLPASFAYDTAGGDVPSELPPDPLSADVLRALDATPPQRTWLQSTLLLAVSLVLFAGAGFFSYTPTDLVLLVAVLLFHESGHYLGMRLFNYRDVRMFFIPFFGAAVAGRTTSAAGYKEAIVLLLGPLPGIVLGTVLGIVCLFYDSSLLRSATFMLLAINGFNLLPLLPLDGGRLLHLIVFSRQRHVEAVFRVVTAILLALCALLLGAWLLAIPAVFILLGTQLTFYVSKLAQELRWTTQPAAALDLSGQIPPEQALPLIGRVRQTFPTINQPATLANIVRQVWERMHVRPPGLLASVLLLGIYAGSFLGTPLVGILFQIPIPSVVSHRQPSGELVQRREVRVWGRLREATELGPGGELHGAHVEYFPNSDQMRTEGSFDDGLQEGTWTYYTAEGQVESRQEFRRGQRVQQQ